MQRMWTFANETRLRKGPSGNAEELAALPPATEVLVLGEEGSFCRVRVAGDQGKKLEGYIAGGFLQPPPAPGEEKSELSEQRSTEQGRHSGTRPRFPWPRFDRATGWLAVGLALLFVTNLVTAIVLGMGIRDLQGRSYHVTCSGGYSSQTYAWGRHYDFRVDPEYFEDGQVKIDYQYLVMEKLPGAEIILRHHLVGEDDWQEVVMQESSERAMHFVASLYLEPSANIEYQVLQRLHGENVRADATSRLDVSSWAGGDLYFRQYALQGKTELVFSYQPQRPPTVAALQAEKIVVNIDQKEPLEVTLYPEERFNNDFRATVQIEGFKALTITVHYQDGEQRIIELDYLPVEQITIQR